MKEKLKNNKNKLNKIIFSKFVKENFDVSCCEIKRKYVHSLKDSLFTITINNLPLNSSAFTDSTTQVTTQNARRYQSP